MATENEEKRELLKLKQGIIEESDIIEVETVSHEQKKLKGKKWLANFWYHNKWFLIVGVFGALAIGFMTWQLISREAADATVLLVATDNKRTPDMFRRVNDFEKALELYCPDFDGNGNVHVDVYYIDLDKNNSDYNYINANSTKFFGEMQRGLAHLMIFDEGIIDTDEHKYTEAELEQFFLDLGKVTGDETFSGEHFIQLNQTVLAADALWENSCPNSVRIGIKNETPDMIGYSEQTMVYNDRARQLLKNILTKNVVN